jgi:metal-sulfur cluster biosynthetic enzyme
MRAARATLRGRLRRPLRGLRPRPAVTAKSLRDALAGVLDPEYPVSLVDLGLIRGLAVEDGTAKVEVTFCSLGCPCTELIRDDIEERLLELPGIHAVEIEEVYEPWSRADISPRGLARLRQVGVT